MVCRSRNERIGPDGFIIRRDRREHADEIQRCIARVPEGVRRIGRHPGYIRRADSEPLLPDDVLHGSVEQHVRFLDGMRVQRRPGSAAITSRFAPNRSTARFACQEESPSPIIALAL